MATPDQPATWFNTPKANYDPLWSATVLPWSLLAPWQWDNSPAFIDNPYQVNN